MKRTNNLVTGIRAGTFIKDDSLQRFVDAVFQRVVSMNSIRHVPGRVLILRNPMVNAYCYGEGTFIVTIGLLSKIRTEAELAFVIAHELAHYELNHVRDKILYTVENNLARKTSREVNKILSGDVTLEDLSALRELLYGVSRFNREKEMQADSLGFVFFRSANFNPEGALSLLSVLDSAQHAKYPVDADLFLPLHSTHYPFQDHWLNQRLSIYSRKPVSTLVFSNDSIESHPDIEIRKKQLDAWIESSSLPVNHQSEEFVNEIIQVAEFEAVESAYYNKQYDLCLFLALQLQSRYPKNAYLVSTIGKVFIDLCEARNDGMFIYRLPRYTTHYSPELRMVNNFLHNLSETEMREVTYHFLNNQSHFNPDVRQHYYLLWKISHLSYRSDVQRKVKQAYIAKFGKDRYYHKLR